MSTLFFFLISVSILVVFHEYGHYLVARLLGVTVLRFSVGFGKPVVRWYNRHGTEFVIALVPMGGYVKMLDLPQAIALHQDPACAFESKPLWAKSLIVLAGPLFNFLLAILFYAATYCIGFQTLTPIIGSIEPYSLAAQAGIPTHHRIVQCNGNSVDSWRQVTMQLLAGVGSHNPIPILLEDLNSQQQVTRFLPLKDFDMDNTRWPIEQMGIMPMDPPMPAVIDTIVPDSPAEKGGLQAGDRVLSVDSHPIVIWPDLVTWIREHPGTSFRMTILRDNRLHTFPVTAGTQPEGIGYIGISVHTLQPPYVQSVQLSWGKSLLKGASLTWEHTILSLQLFYKMVIGTVSLAHLSGPISIAQGAEASASLGLLPFLGFLALLSISLGVVNLLPIPTLDGGHLLYYGIEGLLGRPLSMRIQQIGFKIGISLLVGLMLIAIFNDLVRFFTPA